MHLRSLGILGATIGACTALLTAACSDDSSPPTGTTPTGHDASVADARSNPIDAGGGSETSTDAGDAGTDATGPTVTVTTGMYGLVEVLEFLSTSEFRVDDTVIRSSDAPGCVAVVRSSVKPGIDVGAVTIGGDAVGDPQGLPAALSIQADPQNENTYFGEVADFDNHRIFLSGTSWRVQAQVEGRPDDGVPALPVTTLRSSPFASIAVLTPTLPDGGALVVKSDQDFKITWTVPTSGGTDAGGAGEQMILDLWFLLGGSRVGQIRCGAPVSAGQGFLPRSLLKEMRNRLSPNAPIEGATLRIRSGDRREVVIPAGPGGFEATYLIEVAHTTGTDFGGDFAFGELSGGVTLD